MSVDPDEAGAQAGASASVPHIQVILGSTRNGRLGDRVAAWFMGHASVRRDLTAELVDLRDWPLPFFDEPTPPIRGGYANPAQRAWAAKVEAADGYVFVSPEYNHGYTAVLKNALDHLYAEWTYKPAGFVGYGGLGGGIRAVEQLRQVVVELDDGAGARAGGDPSRAPRLRIRWSRRREPRPVGRLPVERGRAMGDDHTRVAAAMRNRA